MLVISLIEADDSVVENGEDDSTLLFTTAIPLRRQSQKRVKDFSYRYINHIFYGRIQRATRCWFGKLL